MQYSYEDKQQKKTENQTTKKISASDNNSLSPILFNLIMVEIIEEVNGKGHLMVHQSVKIIC